MSVLLSEREKTQNPYIWLLNCSTKLERFQGVPAILGVKIRPLEKTLLKRSWLSRPFCHFFPFFNVLAKNETDSEQTQPSRRVLNTHFAYNGRR